MCGSPVRSARSLRRGWRRPRALRAPSAVPITSPLPPHTTAGRLAFSQTPGSPVPRHGSPLPAALSRRLQPLFPPKRRSWPVLLSQVPRLSWGLLPGASAWVSSPAEVRHDGSLTRSAFFPLGSLPKAQSLQRAVSSVRAVFWFTFLMAGRQFRSLSFPHDQRWEGDFGFSSSSFHVPPKA